MSLVSSIKSQIIKKISALSTVENVYGHEEVNPEGAPSVCVVQTGMVGEFISTASNSRVYSFRLYVLFPVGKDLTGLSGDRLDEAERIVSEVVDQSINALDTDYELGRYNSQVLYVKAVNSEYQYTILETGWAKSAILTVQVYTEQTVQ